MNAYVNQYQNNQVLNASPEQILIMLYDGAIRFVRQAKMAISDGREADKSRAIGKVVAIVGEFSNTLDRELGGDVAEDLSRLYDFMLRELSEANLSKDIAKLEPVEKILLDLREAFAGAADLNRKNAQSSQSPQPENTQPQSSLSQYGQGAKSGQYGQGAQQAPKIPPTDNPAVRNFVASG